MTYESFEDGVLSVIAEVGSTLPVGALIASIGNDVIEAAPRPAIEDAGPTLLQESTLTRSPAPALASPVQTTDCAISATPLARRLARIRGVDLAQIRGSGRLGRVLRADVAVAAGVSPHPADLQDRATTRPGATPDSAASAPDHALAAAAGGATTVRELTRLQRAIARRMTEAKATVPEFQVQTEVTMDAAIAFREQLKDDSGALVPSINDMIVKASALALRAHPLANASYADGHFELHARVNIGIAIAAPDALVVATITDADTRSLTSIASEARRLVERVRDATITPPELSDATFTVSNLGMYGMTAITPIINPPQAAILGVGTARAVPAITNGDLTERHLMTLTLTCDHRILYGAGAAQFLSSIRELLEQPLRLAL